MKILYLVTALLVGIAMIFYGEIDDSPGLMLLGLLLIITSVIILIKRNKKSGLSLKQTDQTQL